MAGIGEKKLNSAGLVFSSEVFRRREEVFDQVKRPDGTGGGIGPETEKELSPASIPLLASQALEL